MQLVEAAQTCIIDAEARRKFPVSPGDLVRFGGPGDGLGEAQARIQISAAVRAELTQEERQAVALAPFGGQLPAR